MQTTKGKITKQTALKVVKEFVIECKKSGVLFDHVILFGSAARNKTHKYSDIDVAFSSRMFNDNPIEDRRLLNRVIVKNNRFLDIETHPFPTKYFNEGDPFIDEIKRTGIEIKM